MLNKPVAQPVFICKVEENAFIKYNFLIINTVYFGQPQANILNLINLIPFPHN